ncbi:MAG: DUF2156 domain-containing protein [Candidatus Kerfeldbacteria bacterium]|nr:DUF2156 domain-containing protein [Candidatus Kerfeldbacteria bacterium]
MIAHFPNFSPLQTTHREHVVRTSFERLPYSDHNFTSLWSWNAMGDAHISQHNDNVLVLLNDYIDSSKKILTLIGAKNFPDSVKDILSGPINALPKILDLIPEDLMQQLDEKYFIITEDRASHDYIYDVKKLLTYSGNKYGAKRNFVNRFKKKCPEAYCIHIDLSKEINRQKILDLFNRWTSYRAYLGINHTKEFNALKSFLEHSHIFDNIISLGLYDNEVLIGFAIVEFTNKDYCIIHFEKADYTNYIGIYPFLMQKVAELANGLGCLYINYEQDLGLDFLEKSKKSYHPEFFLKKYKVSLK